MRDTLLKSLAADIIQEEEDRKKERAERWERVVALYRKKSEQAPGAKPTTTSRKGGSSASPATSLQTREQLPEERSRKEGSENISLMGETNPEE